MNNFLICVMLTYSTLFIFPQASVSAAETNALLKSEAVLQTPGTDSRTFDERKKTAEVQIAGREALASLQERVQLKKQQPFKIDALFPIATDIFETLHISYSSGHELELSETPSPFGGGPYLDRVDLKTGVITETIGSTKVVFKPATAEWVKRMQREIIIVERAIQVTADTIKLSELTWARKELDKIYPIFTFFVPSDRNNTFISWQKKGETIQFDFPYSFEVLDLKTGQIHHVGSGGDVFTSPGDPHYQQALAPLIQRLVDNIALAKDNSDRRQLKQVLHLVKQFSRH